MYLNVYICMIRPTFINILFPVPGENLASEGGRLLLLILIILLF